MSIAGLDPAIQVYNLANCFTWTPHQVRRDIREEAELPNCRPELVSGSQIKIRKQVRHDKQGAVPRDVNCRA